MLRSVVLATALVSLALPALARGELSERQKRKALLPALHATTECIAQEILRSPTALSYARQNKWFATVQSMPEGTVNLIGSGRDKARGEAGHTNAYAQAATPVTAAQV